MTRSLIITALTLGLAACGGDDSSGGGSCNAGDISADGAPCCNLPPLTAEDCPEGWEFFEIPGIDGGQTSGCRAASGDRIGRDTNADGQVIGNVEKAGEVATQWNCYAGGWALSELVTWPDPAQPDRDKACLDCWASDGTSANCDDVRTNGSNNAPSCSDVTIGE